MDVRLMQTSRDGVEDGFSVSIAMATYNGARFIAEQLASLAQQTLLPRELVVSDDGSTDTTLDIVRAFAATAPFTVTISPNAHRLGFADNFLKAAGLTSSEWIAFCDQDDRWEPDKLRIVAAAVRDDPEILLVTHPSRVMRDDQPTEQLVGPVEDAIYPPLALHPLQVYNGHSLVFRRVLLDLLPVGQRPFSAHTPQWRMPHDDWITFLAGALGKTRILAAPLVLYRYHAGNVSEAFRRRTDLLDMFRRGKLIDVSEIDRHCTAARDRIGQMRDVRATTPAIAENARRAVTYYERLTLVLEYRAALWAAASLPRRAALALNMLRRGGYRDFTKGGIGRREGVKDFVFGVLYGGARREP